MIVAVDASRKIQKAPHKSRQYVDIEICKQAPGTWDLIRSIRLYEDHKRILELDLSNLRVIVFVCRYGGIIPDDLIELQQYINVKHPEIEVVYDD